MNTFSQKGEAPTELECELFSQQPRMSHNVWVLIGQRIGLAALLVVLDELGGEKFHVPPRSFFVHQLWAPVRNAQIATLNAQHLSHSQIARRVGVSRTCVSAVLRKSRTRKRTERNC